MIVAGLQNRPSIVDRIVNDHLKRTIIKTKHYFIWPVWFKHSYLVCIKCLPYIDKSKLLSRGKCPNCYVPGPVDIAFCLRRIIHPITLNGRHSIALWPQALAIFWPHSQTTFKSDLLMGQIAGLVLNCSYLSQVHPPHCISQSYSHF